MTTLASTPYGGVVEADIELTYKKVFWRIVPFLMLCYVVAYLDRVNVGFAKLQMSQDLAFSQTICGLRGWQWMFLMEAVPALLMGIAVLLYLDNSIRAAKWLDEGEKRQLERQIAIDQEGSQSYPSTFAVFRDSRIWQMSLIYFCFVM